MPNVVKKTIKMTYKMKKCKKMQNKINIFCIKEARNKFVAKIEIIDIGSK